MDMKSNEDTILTFMNTILATVREACKIYGFHGFEPLTSQNQISALNSMLLFKTRLQFNTNNK